MNESPNFLLLAILYGSLVIVSLRHNHYKLKSERLQRENSEMAEKLGKKMGVCQHCGEPMLINNNVQKYHTECGAEINNIRIMAKLKTVKNKIQAKTIMMRNGVEILANVFGKEIGSNDNYVQRLKAIKGEKRNA